MCELGFCSVSRPHTDRQRGGEMNEGRKDMKKLSNKGGKEEGDRNREMKGSFG